MTEETRPNLPIGYWIKQADNLLTEAINKAQATHGVSRSDWQVLNMLQETGRTSREQIYETMRAFVDATTFEGILTRLAQWGWVEETPLAAGSTLALQLTEEGLRRHEAILATQQAVRRRAMQGVSEAEYMTAIHVLQRIAKNLNGIGD